MTRELAEAIVTCLEAEEIECEFYPDYSGRGMFGRTTLGITGDFTIVDVLECVVAHAELLCENGESMFVRESLQQDNMAQQYIIY